MMKFAIAAVVVAATATACTKTVDQCKGDADCTDVAFPFCDVNGEYPPSGGAKGVCTIVPPDCPVDRCGCDPGATTCGSGQLTTCNPDGKSQTMVTCSVGCESDGTACMTFTPANGLGPALTQAAMEQDEVFPGTVTIDTTTGSIKDSSGVSVTVTSLVVAQGNTSIRVFVGKSFAIHNATITGTMAVAFVAQGTIALDGIMDASANASAAGPGAVEPPDPSAGQGLAGHGGGGGGNATGGGSGAPTFTSIGPIFSAGGMMQSTFEPLVGGARGGDADGVGVDGGGGGGGVEIVSMTEIDLNAGAIVDVGGGGGGVDGSAGGSGGNVILQAPTVNIMGALTANGASGSACGILGLDGTENASLAASVACNTQGLQAESGAGGNATTAPTAGVIDKGTGTSGGGGAVGRASIGTLDGTFQQGTAAVISATVTTQMLITM